MGWSNRTGLLFFAALIAATPYVLPNHYFYLIQIGIYALLCIGLSLLLGYAGQISLGHAAFFAIGAYTSGVLSTQLEWSPWFALLAGIVLSVLVALLIGVPSLRLSGHYLAMATLAFGEIVYVIAKAWVSVTGGPSGFGRIPKWNLFGYELIPFRRDMAIFWFVWGAAWLGLLVALNIIHSRVGRGLRSIHDGEEAANVLGVPTSFYKVQVFVVSAIYASVAGSIYAHVRTFVNPSPFGIEYSILFIIMVIVGGMRSVWGALIGALVMGLLPEVLSQFENAEKWRFTLYGLVLILVMMFVPQGLLLGLRDLLGWGWRKLSARGEA